MVNKDNLTLKKQQFFFLDNLDLVKGLNYQFIKKNGFLTGKVMINISRPERKILVDRLSSWMCQNCVNEAGELSQEGLFVEEIIDAIISGDNDPLFQ